VQHKATIKELLLMKIAANQKSVADHRKQSA
jgi:hypothetical protein